MEVISIKRKEFISNILGDSFTPHYDVIRSIKLFSETIDGKYKAIYISEEDDQLYLSLVEKGDVSNMEKSIKSFPAFIKGDYIYLADKDKYNNQSYQYIKEREDCLYINPVILGLIKDGMFKYISKDSIVRGGEPALTEESIKVAFGMPKNIELTSEKLYDYALLKDYKTKLKLTPKNNYVFKKRNMAVLTLFNYCAFGYNKPNLNIRHSVCHPYEFFKNKYGDNIIHGEFSSKGSKNFFHIKDEGEDVLIQYPEDKINMQNAKHFVTGKHNKKIFNYVVKSWKDYILEKEGGA